MIRNGRLTRLKLTLEDNSVQEWECVTKDVGNDRLALAVPRENPDFSRYFQEGKEIEVFIYSPEGIATFKSMIIDSCPTSDFVIEYCGEYSVIERRRYPRAYFETKLILERLTCQQLVATTVDIGGCSVKFTYETPFRPNEWVNSKLYIPLLPAPIRIAGTIVKKNHLAEKEYVLLYNNISEEGREKIIEKCNEIYDSKTQDCIA